MCKDINKKQYISDIITNEDIEKWNDESYVLIKSPTGSGKSHFILNILSNYCKDRNKKILLLTNRDILKEQFKKDIKDNCKTNITVMNYQALEEIILKKEVILDYYDYICLDEIHYIWSDSSFNIKTNLILNWIQQCNNGSIKILCSATCRIVEQYKWNKNLIKYEILNDYSYIDKIYFYYYDDVVEKLISRIPKDEKILYFLHSATEAYQSSLKIDKASFICSKHNNNFKCFINDEERDNIINEQMFNARVLCTTSTLDTGITIKDKQLKHIICDIFDLETLLQCIGRKRQIDETDTVTLYIRDRSNRHINGKIQSINNELEYAEYLQENGSKAFADKYYKKRIGSVIDVIPSETNIDYEINEAKYIKLIQDKDYYDKIKSVDYGYKKEVCKLLGVDIKEVLSLEDYFDSMTLEQYLENLSNKKMFKEDQEKLKEFFLRSLFNCMKSNHGSLGLKTINGYFEDNKLEFRITSGKENSRKSENYKQTYWMILKTLE